MADFLGLSRMLWYGLAVFLGFSTQRAVTLTNASWFQGARASFYIGVPLGLIPTGSTMGLAKDALVAAGNGYVDRESDNLQKSRGPALLLPLPEAEPSRYSYGQHAQRFGSTLPPGNCAMQRTTQWLTQYYEARAA